MTDDDCPPINPDCLQGKHRACGGDAWDFEYDELTECACECHEDAPVVDVVASL